LEQDPGDDAIPGTIENPVMICPVCQQEFRATGMRWLGAWDIADMTDEELDEFAVALNRQLGEMAKRMRLSRDTSNGNDPPS
jgi:hypothetical protein